MVDAIVSFAVERLGDFLIQEAIFSRGVREEVEWLKNELGWMQCFLKDAEEKQDGDNRISKWISEIRDVAYDIEDVIDTFILKIKVEGTLKRKRGLLASIEKISRIFSKEIDYYKIGKDIEALKKRVVDISHRREAYGIKSINDVGEGMDGASGKLRQLRRTSPYADEEHVVGFEDVTTSLVEELVKKDSRRCVISILGMGGLGKTTLARKLYHHSKLEGEFKHRAWVCVSQEYRTRDLLQRIIKSFKKYFSKEELEMLEKMAEEELERYLHEFLKDRRYLVVIDDVWHKEACENLRRAFPDNSKGSRIIVTTRIKAVAEHSDERAYVHELRFLRPDESWELFCKKAFPCRTAKIGDTRDHCPLNLQMIGREMVEKCHGLPLAIIVLGGLLSSKKAHEWCMVKEPLWRDLRNDFIHIPQILALSFKDLPYQLKPCFLYLGLFPEDFEINTEKLIRLWVAEGFISPREHQTLEEVAEDLLNELIGRSLIQAAKRSWASTTVCRVHDLLRDLAVKKAKELNFFHIYDGSVNSIPSSSTAPLYRRQAAHSRIERYVSVHEFSNPCLRTLLFFDPDHKQSNVQQLTFIHTRFKLLRVLDLQSVHVDYIEGVRGFPDAVGELIHLRYLGLRDTGTKDLPPSIVNLRALQTLDAFTDGVSVRLPGNICKLDQLRHLIGFFEGPLRVDHLTNLQTLKFVKYHDWVKINPVNLINIRELRITNGWGVEQKGFNWDPISNLRNLQSLSVHLPSPMYFHSIQPLSNFQHLLQLLISGRIEKLPEQMHEFFPRLKYLYFGESQLMKDPMPTLKKLPNLIVLHLRFDNFKKLTCTAEGFPQLEVLVLDQLYCLEELEVEEGALPMLKGFQVFGCDKFTVPERLRSIPDAKNLNWDCGGVAQYGYSMNGCL